MELGPGGDRKRAIRKYRVSQPRLKIQVLWGHGEAGLPNNMTVWSLGLVSERDVSMGVGGMSKGAVGFELGDGDVGRGVWGVARGRSR